MNRTIQWLNANRYRRYPFVDDTAPNISGQQLPDNLLLDFQLVDYVVTPDNPFIVLKTITFSTTSVRQATFAFEYSDSVTLTVTVPLNAAFPYNAVLINSSDHMTVVIGEGLLELSTAYPVDAIYAVTDGSIQPALVTVQNRHRINSLTGDTDDSVTIYGDVCWEEGYSVRIELSVGAKQLRINAVPGAGAGYPCDSSTEDRPSCNDVLIAVNSVYGDAAGNIELVGGHGISIEPDPDNHVIVIRTRMQALDIECGDE